MTLVCIRCGESGEKCRVSVDLVDGDTIQCDACDAEYTVDDVRAALDSWGPYLSWLDAHPGRKLEPTCRAAG